MLKFKNRIHELEDLVTELKSRAAIASTHALHTLQGSATLEAENARLRDELEALKAKYEPKQEEKKDAEGNDSGSVQTPERDDPASSGRSQDQG